METKLPAPCVVVLIGPSSSGKTRWAGENFRSNEVVSSDALRAQVGVDESDQSASAKAFEILEMIVDARLERRLTTVIDSTGLDPERRRSWIERGHRAGLPVYAALMDTPAAVCERRNAERDRPIPRSVLRKQLSRFDALLGSIEGEGFDGTLRQQPVAAVPPQLATPSSEPVEEIEASSHTFGLALSRFDWSDPPRLGEQITSIANRAEAAGFSAIWPMDHFRQIPQVGRPWEDLPEAYTLLSYLAGVTETIRLGVLVTSITHRHPLVLGKMVATLDVLSGGRATCGLGIGWDAKEHAVYGIDFPEMAKRYALLEDTLQALPLLWGRGSPSFEGKTFSAGELTCYPRPVQDRIPILVGGSGETRTLRIAARYADACNLMGPPEEVSRLVGVLERHCHAHERDPAEVEVTHRLNALAARDRSELEKRVNRLRGRGQSFEEYTRAHNAGTTDEIIALFHAYHRAGARHSIVTIPDVDVEGSVEAFGPVIAAFAAS